MDQVRCVHLVPTTEQAGAETRARELLAGLIASGYCSLELVHYLAGSAQDRFAELGIPMRKLGLRGGRLALDLPRLAYRLSAIYARQPPAILHTWLTNGNVVGLLAARRWASTRVIITQCGGRGEEIYMRHHLRLQRLLSGRADLAISNSDEGAEVLARWGIPEDRIAVIRNGIASERIRVDESRESVRKRLGMDAEAPLVAVGVRANNPYVVEQKNLPGLLDAMRRVRESFPAARLVLIGATAAELAEFGVALPEWASATGFVPRISNLLAAADVVALASNAEGTSNVACEAMMLGLPVATTDVGDHGAIAVSAGGRKVAAGDMAALARAISELIARPPRPEFVRERAAAALGIDRMVTETLGAYERTLALPRT
jgi:glycosyltransferase involved in cell wall biosynthesis